MNDIETTRIKLEKLLPTADIITKSTTGSTNTDARDIARQNKLKRPLLIVADHQSCGRGRQGKAFHSPSGGLYMTLALPCGLPLADTLGVTSCTAVAVSDAIDSLTGADCGIKWVNDIYLETGSDAGKLCGILVESVNDYEKMVSEVLIIGIGVNLTEAPSVTDSSVKAISLADCGYSCSRTELCAAIVNRLLTFRQTGFSSESWIDEYRRRSIVTGREVTFVRNGVTYSGTASAITDSGSLIVNCGGDTVMLDSGEIHLRVK